MRHIFGTAIVAVLMLGGASSSLAGVVSYNDLATFQASTGPLAHVDFDCCTGGTEIGNTYAGLGVTFPIGNRFEAGFIQPVSNPNGWINDTSRFFDADFSAGVTAVGVHNVFNAGTSTLTAYGVGGVVLGSVTSDSENSTLDFFGITTMADILRIEINVVNSGWGLDDLYFGTSGSAVPAPSMLSLLLIALGGLGMLSRRRKSS